MEQEPSQTLKNAVEKGKADILKILLRCDDPDEADLLGLTLRAAKYNHADCVGILVAKMQHQETKDRTLIELIGSTDNIDELENASMECIQIAVKNGANPRHEDTEGEEGPLCHALFYENWEAAKWFHKQGANLHAVGEFADRPFMDAARTGKRQGMDWLLSLTNYSKESKKLAEIFYQEAEQKTQEVSKIPADIPEELTEATEAGNLEEIRFLMKITPPKKRAERAHTALKITCMAKKPKEMKLLLQEGAKPDELGEFLMECVKNNNPEGLQILLKTGAHIDLSIAKECIAELEEDESKENLAKIIMEALSLPDLEELRGRYDNFEETRRAVANIKELRKAASKIQGSEPEIEP